MRLLVLVGLSLGLVVGCGQASLETAIPGASPSPSASPMATASPVATADIPSPGPSFPAGRVATRVVIERLGIDLPIVLQKSSQGTFPLCNVALYLPELGQPGEGIAIYLYAHARAGMFLPLLSASRINAGAGLIGDIVQVYTSDNYRFLYRIAEVNQHTLDLTQAFNTTTERLFLQTSEGPHGTVPKLQVVADFTSEGPADPKAAHPTPHPYVCG